MGRISTSQLYTSQLQLIQMQREQLNQLQTQLATQKQFSRDSENMPAATTVNSLTYYNQQLDNYASTQTTAKFQQQLQATVLSAAQNTLNQINQLASNGVQGQISDSTQRTQLASQLSNLRDSLLATVNTQDTDNNYIFGGGKVLTQPYKNSGSGYVFQGDNYNRTATIGANQSVVTYQSGQGVFGDSSNNVFNQIQVMIDKLNSPTFTSSDFADFKTAAAAVNGFNDNVTTAITANANAQIAVKSEASITSQLQNQNTSTIAGLVNIDPAQVIVQINAQLTAYQASLAAFQQIGQNSLFKSLFG